MKTTSILILGSAIAAALVLMAHGSSRQRHDVSPGESPSLEAAADLAFGVGASPVAEVFDQQSVEPEIDYPAGKLTSRSPGTDTSLCMSWEPTVAVDTSDPRIVAVAQGSTIQYSLDSGAGFTMLNGPAPSVCDDGSTVCYSNSDCNGIGTGICYTGQCSQDNAYCSVTQPCAPSPPMQPANNCGTLFGGDASIAFDSQSRLFISYLCRLPSGPRDVCIVGYELNGGGTAYQTISGIDWPVRVTVEAGRPGQNNDKNWLAADWYTSSPFTDRLHMVWVDLGGPNGFEIYTSFSDNQGEDWSTAQVVSPTDGSEGTVWPPHNTVAPNGDLYVSYHSQTGFLPNTSAPDGTSGKVVVVRSPDGGSTFSTCDDNTACFAESDCNGIGSGDCNDRSEPFPSGLADTTFNVQHFRFCDDGTTICTQNSDCNGIGSGTCNAAQGAIPGAAYWTFGTAQAWLMADPDVPGRVYVVTSDDPDNNVNSGDAADVVIVRSDDFGGSWTNPAQVDDGPAGTFQLFPTAAIDPITGAIGVTYYDNRAGLTNVAGDFLLDLRASYSYDSGTTWLPSVDINDGTLDPSAAGQCRFCGSAGPTNARCNAMNCVSGGPGTTRIGEYNGIAFGECTGHVAWADNIGPTCGGDLDTWYDSDPEAGGDLDPPVPLCPNDLEISCTESTSPSNTGEATATDECTVEPTIASVDNVVPGDCPQEMTIKRTWTAADKAGNSDSCLQTIEVVDDGAPTVFVPDPVVLECSAPGGVPANDPLAMAWLDSASAVDDCGTAMVSNDAPALFPATCPPGDPTVVTFTGTDECGNSASDTSGLTVVDTTPPMVSCGVTVDELWPPEHEFVDVGFSFTALDTCDTDPAIVVSVSSDEHAALVVGAGGEIHCPDAVVTDDDRVLLRSERSGARDGRVYVINVQATDNCGNQAACQATVKVPMSMNPHIEAVDSGQAHDATVCGPQLVPLQGLSRD
jgi:hypothetical protein